jgi:hypothetical protein
MTQAAQLDAAAVVLHELRTPTPGAPRRQRPQLVSHIRRQLSAEPSMEGDGIRPEAYEQPSPADASRHRPGRRPARPKPAAPADAAATTWFSSTAQPGDETPAGLYRAPDLSRPSLQGQPYGLRADKISKFSPQI